MDSAFASAFATDSGGGISLLYPLGAAPKGGVFKVWPRIARSSMGEQIAAPTGAWVLRGRWFDGEGRLVGAMSVAELSPERLANEHVAAELTLTAPSIAGRFTLHLDLVTRQEEPTGHARLSLPVDVLDTSDARAAIVTGVRALSYAWGTDRGLPPHRYYLERFLEAARSDVHGRCLEFQDPTYAHRLGGNRISTLDILHVDDSSPHATIVADLTRRNDIPSDRFDCIVCTHVLHMIEDVRKAIAELHRILKPGGVLLIGVPHLSAFDPRDREYWRFTPYGLGALLHGSFGTEDVLVQGFGNSLVAAADLRGLVITELDPLELEVHDPWFPVEVCARAVKRDSHGG